MSKIKLTGSNSGYVEIDSAADAGNLTLTLPTSGVRLLSNTDNVFSGITTTAELDINGKIDVSTDAVIARNLSVGGITTHTGTTTLSDDVTFTGGSYNVVWDKSDNQLEFADNAKLSFGADADLQLWHNGNHSNIKNSTGRLYILADDIWIKDGNDGDIHARFLHDDASELYFDGGKKLETTNTGVTVTGIVAATSFSGSGSGLTGVTTATQGRNMLINGEMVANQRSNGGQNVNSSTSRYPVDRWHSRGEGGKNFTVSQVAGASQGLGVRHYMRAAVTSHGSVGSNDIFNFRQNIEGYNIQRINLGESTCNSIALSFTVRSSLAGTHSGAIQNSAQNRSYPFTYVLSANTWTNVKIIIPPITSGSFNETNGVGLRVVFDLGSGNNFRGTAGQWNSAQDEGATGAVRLIENASATWDITKIQLEEGTVCTPFEKKLYADVIRDCMRYYQVVNSSIISPILNNGARIPLPILPVEMRGTPTPGTSAGTFTEFSSGTTRTITGFYSSSSKGGGYAQLNGNAGNGVYVNAYFDAEI